ncbi:response regulator transcription factor [Winogradskyella sp.]|uniref:response regulator transcription factor n=1 Tax=Winogradskyella sp. TaxID=1883156 RepID=UPI003F6B87DF
MEFRSDANRKLNNKKWFKSLQEYFKNTKEPIAELYIYSFLSYRSSDLHNYYVDDLKNNRYYNELLARLEENYPSSPYTGQYINELEADRYMLEASSERTSLRWGFYLYLILALSLTLNAFLLYKSVQSKRITAKNIKTKLSNQEQVVLEHLLQEKTNKNITESLFLSVSTVKSHTNNIYKKLNVKSRVGSKSLFNK